jgi:hypothetical protein
MEEAEIAIAARAFEAKYSLQSRAGPRRDASIMALSIVFISASHQMRA